MGKTGIIAVIIVILALVGGAFAISKRNSNKTQPTTSTNQTSTNSTPSTSDTTASGTSAQTSSDATITYTDNGFSPATLTVKSGTKVTIKNDSSNPLQFDSDPHPVHTDDPELNVGVVSPGKSMTFTVTTKGSHGYHNHLNSSDTGTIVVQ